MKDRIKSFMDFKSISAAELADSLGVQRSNVSHILNGRNYPGATFIEKFLVTYPELDARWLITGEGDMLSSRTTAQTVPDIKRDDLPRSQVRKPPQKDDVPDLSNTRKIERIMVFYTDKTFTEYSPSV
jgi:transcriptional regulator with XRE-family HTH domain